MSYYFYIFLVNKEVDTIDVDTTVEDNENEKDEISGIDKEIDFEAEAQECSTNSYNWRYYLKVL